MTLNFLRRQSLHLAAGAAGRIASREGAPRPVHITVAFAAGGGGCSTPVSCVTMTH